MSELRTNLTAGMLVLAAISASADAAAYRWNGSNVNWSSVSSWFNLDTDSVATAVPGAGDTISQSVEGGGGQVLITANRQVDGVTWSVTPRDFVVTSANTALTLGVVSRGTVGGEWKIRSTSTGGILNLTSLSLSAGTTTLNSFATTVSGTTVIDGAAILSSFGRTGIASSFGTLSFTGSANPAGSVLLSNVPAGGDTTTRTVEVASIASAFTSSVIAAGSTSAAAGAQRNAILVINGTTGQTQYDGKLVNNASLNTNSSLALQKTAANTLTLGGNLNTYSGGTTLSGGKLIITNNSTSSATGTGAVSVSGDTTTLAGTGTIRGAAAAVTVTSGGRLAPAVNTSGANSNFGVAGTLNLGLLNGGLALTDANLDFDLATTAAGTSDLITTSGTLGLGTLKFHYNLLGATLEESAWYTLITGATSAPADLSGVDITTFGADGYTPTYRISGNALQVQFAVPEPSTALIALAAGAFAMAARRRRA